jgi:hypothetical protein
MIMPIRVLLFVIRLKEIAHHTYREISVIDLNGNSHQHNSAETVRLNAEHESNKKKKASACVYNSGTCNIGGKTTEYRQGQERNQRNSRMILVVFFGAIPGWLLV